jgi:acyl transferase domain-containing protein/acyl carrier protein
VQPRESLREWLMAQVAEKLGVAPDAIDDAQAVADLGVSSAKAVEISAAIQDRFALNVGPAVLYDHPTIAALVAYLEGLRSNAPGQSTLSRALPDEPIAIVGIGCRFPGCEAGPLAYLQMLKQGRDAISEVDASRWNSAQLYSCDPDVPGKACTKWGGFLQGIELFDPEAFATPASEAPLMDPQQRLLLEASTHAIEDAGCALGQLAATRTGVFVGISRNEYAHTRELPTDNPLSATGSALSIAANRISYLFDLLGPSVALDSACSSSLLAVHTACRSLKSGEVDCALAGGVNVVLSPDLSIAFTKAGLMAPDGRCKPFSNAANGYVRGEGVGMVMLQRLSDALKQRRRIYALIRGTAVVQDGRSNGLMAPRGTSQERVILNACREANVAPQMLDYIETHGTGTRLGDVIEATAIGNVMQARTTQQGRCILGSVKSNIGHLEAAAGVAALIKTALCLHARVLVPTLHFDTPNESIDFERLGLTVGTQTQDWPRQDKPRVAGVSSFGFGGTNVHAVLAEFDGHECDGVSGDARETGGPAPSLLALSAHQPQSLRGLASSYIQHIEAGDRDSCVQLLQASFARTERRYRLAVVGDTPEKILAGLRAHVAGAEHPCVLSGEGGKRGKLAFVFSGQAGQWPDGGKALFETYPIYRAALLECDEALRPHLGASILPVLFAQNGAQSLAKTEYAQPALFAMQFALLQQLEAWQLAPQLCIGHSVGEIAAACAAGALTLEQAARLVVLRARAMAGEAGRGCMAVVRADSARVQALIDAQNSSATIAAINSTQSTVIAGAHAAVDQLVRLATEQGLAARTLPLNYAFHSEQMLSAAHTFRQGLGAVQAATCRVPFFSTVTGALHEGVLDLDYWCDNIVRPVRFSAAVAAALEFGATAFVELAPSAILNNDIVREAALRGARASVVSVLRRGVEALTTLSEAVGSLFTSGQVCLHALASRAGESVPTYPWTSNRYWFSASTAEQAVPSHRPGLKAPRLEAPIAIASHPGTRLWRGAIDMQDSPYLLDHQIVGEPVLPGAAHLTLLLDAMSEELDRCSLRDLRLDRPLPLAERDVLHVQATEQRTSDDEHSLALFYSRSRPEGAPWEKVASARRVRAAKPMTDPIGLDAVRARCLEQYPSVVFYELLARRGLTYGPAFRLLEQVVGRKGEALGRLTASAARDASDLTQPAVLDACLHVIAAALGARELGGSQLGLLLPQGIEQVNVLRRGVPRWSYARVMDVNGEQLKADVLVLDEHGAVLAELSGVRLSGSRQTLVQAKQHRRLRDWLYRVDWVEKAAQRGAHGESTAARGGRCLVLCDRAGFGAALADTLETVGLTCVRVEQSATFADRGNGRYAASADADLRRIIRLYGDEPWRFVFYCWGLDSSGIESPASDITAHPRALISVVQAAAGEGMRGTVTFAIVTRGAAGVDAAQYTDPLQSMLWGLARTVMFEHPDLDCRCVDIDPDEAVQSAVETVLWEVARADRDNCVAYRAGKRLVRRLRRHELSSAPMRLERGATYIVSGGLGALGLEAARSLAAMGGGRVLLVVRRTPSAKQQQELSALQREYPGIAHEVLDVTDFDAVDELVRREHAIAPVRGVVHAAGVLADAALVNTSAAQIDEVVRPKVLGALALHRAVEGLQLDFFVLFSSVVSVLGSPGQASYCAANAFLDALAEKRSARGERTVSISWGAWAGKGMAAKSAASATLASSRLVNMIPLDDGMELLRALLASAQPHVLVLPFNVKSLVQFYPSNAGLALFDEIAEGAMSSIRSDGAAESIRQRPVLEVEYVAPHSEVQRAIVSIWQSALGMSGIGVRDELFSLGADSVFATQIVAQINRRFGVKLGLDDAFSTFTVEHLADRVDSELLRRVQQMDEAEVALAVASLRPVAQVDRIGA